MLALHEKGHGGVAGIQSQLNHLRALRDKNPLFRLQPVAELGLGQPGEEIQPGVSEVRNFYYTGHDSLLFVFLHDTMAGRERQVSYHQAVLPQEMVCRAKHCLQAGEGGTLWETACLLKAVFDAMINRRSTTQWSPFPGRGLHALA